MSLSCSEFFTAFFHGNRLTNQCFSESCKLNEAQFNHVKVNLVRVLSCLPILGQLIGMFLIVKSIKTIKDPHYMYKVSGIAAMLRGIFTFLGLGIVCLLVDVIVTLAIFIKRKIYN